MMLPVSVVIKLAGCKASVPSVLNYTAFYLFFCSGMRFEGSTIGIAFTATICETPKSAVGLVYDGGEELDRLISTTAHELGHIFGMDHDDSENL